jgi:hypothetical protein
MRTHQPTRHLVVNTLTGIGVALGIVVAFMTEDVILGVLAGALFIAIALSMSRLWTGGNTTRHSHP